MGVGQAHLVIAQLVAQLVTVFTIFIHEYSGASDFVVFKLWLYY